MRLKGNGISRCKREAPERAAAALVEIAAQLLKEKRRVEFLAVREMFRMHGCFLVLLGAAAEVSAAPSSFLLVGGATSPEDTCLVAAKSHVAFLDGCASAVSRLDGSEIWSLAPDGSLMSASSGQCLSLGDHGKDVKLLACDASAAKWELQGNGQIKVASSNMCLTQTGLAPGLVDVASSASIMASSTLNAAHGAALAVDGLAATFWASRLDEPEPVSLTVNLETPVPVVQVALEFEFVPSSFAVQISRDGASWVEVFATEANIVDKVHVPVEVGQAYGLKVVMTKPHATKGVLGGRSLYGVRSLKVMSPGMQAAVEPCATAGASLDARDKYFPVAVASFDPTRGVKLASEVVALEAAGVALSAAANDLATATPNMRKCSATALKAIFSKTHMTSSKLLLGAEAKKCKALLAEARKTIVGARSLLHK